MAILQIEAKLSSEELLRAIDQLNSEDLDQLVEQVLALRDRRIAPILPERESELLLQINQGLPPEIQARYDNLKGRRDAETLTAEEHRELVALTDKIEEIQLQRVEAMIELARLRHRTLPPLMADLGIQASDAA